MIAGRKALICSFVALLMVASCRAQNGSPATNNPPSDTVVSTTPPFQTREPERYRATRTITNVTADGKKKVIKHLIAKDGEMRRLEVHLDSGTLILLDGSQGKFVVLPGEKIYADQAADVPGTWYEGENSPERLLHIDIDNSSYQKLGTESISGRNTEKYRVVVNGANAGNVSSSETLIWIDDALHMPIRSDTKSSDGSRSTMELSEISLEVDKNLFQIPADYKKITRAELVKRLSTW